MSNQRIAVRDEQGRNLGQYDKKSGNFVTADGRELQPTDDEEVQYALSEYAAYNSARLMDDERAESGKVRLMNETITDVRIETPMGNFMQGYKLQEGIADVICPVVMVDQPSKKYWEWNSDDAFQRAGSIATSPGAEVREISPRLSNKRFDTIEYALASAVPTEVIAAAPAPVDPLQAAVRRVQTAMRLEREIRVAALLRAPGNWDSSLVTTLTATTKWNGGSASDPISDLVKLIQASWAPVTRIVMGEQAGFAFSTNPNVQKYVAYKTGSAPIPASSQISALFTLPPITIVNQKYRSSAAGLPQTYTWGGDVVLVHEPPGGYPVDGQDIMTCATFRWNGGTTPDGTYVNGWLVRTYFDHKRGPKGSTVTVTVHQDGEVMTSKLAGGLVVGAYQ
jgi:hypothetical protein